MMAALDWNAVAQISAARMVDCLIEGTLIAFFAGLVLKVARRRNSGTRFAVWFSTLMAIAALPVLSGARWAHVANVPTGAVIHRPAIILPGSWALYLFAGWAVIAAWALLRVGAGLVHLHAVRESCVVIDPPALDSGLRETLARERGTRPAVLCLSDRVQVPTAIGLTKPAVVIPRWLINEMSPAELNQVVLHELAHLRRWDDWTNLVQKIVKALLFFHPAVWWIEKKLSLEREMACDDAVLVQTASPRAYAECLTRLAEKSFLRRSVALAQAAVGRVRQTSLRVAQILDVNRPSATGQVRKPAMSLVVGLAIAGVVCVSHAPRLVAFQDSSPVHAAGPAPAMTFNTLSGGIGSDLASPALATVHAVAWKAAAPVQRARMCKAINPPTAVPANSNSFESFESAFVFEASSPQPDAVDLVHPAGFGASASKAVVVVLEDVEYGSSGQQLVYQISVWRVALPHSAVSPAGKSNPRKT
jgi:beta-lactamase regulating signal transducer with metallopeptidase domain